jgi:hypothetical protein
MTAAGVAVDAPIPHVLTKEQLAAFLGCSCRQIDRYRKLRNHRGVVELDHPGHVRFSGRALKRWLDADTAPSHRAFLASHRRRTG